MLGQGGQSESQKRVSLQSGSGRLDDGTKLRCDRQRLVDCRTQRRRARIHSLFHSEGRADHVHERPGERIGRLQRARQRGVAGRD